MIATILQSTPTFHAVAYNEKKVSEGLASLLEIKNFGCIDTLGYSTPEELQNYLIDYSSRNSRIKNPQFHLALSCKGDEYSDEELLDFAHSYLKEMGYGDPDQPLLIYAHHDTDNNHLHIVTSRVAPDGKKINHNKERVRSQKVLEKLLKQDVKKKTGKDIEAALQFDFIDVRQFKSIMEAMGYQCFEKKGKDNLLYIKKGGSVQETLSLDELKTMSHVNELYKKNSKAELMKLRAIFKKYRDLNSDRKSLEKDLREQFGLALVFMGPKDNPFGYQVVDFRNKKVYDGYKILHIKDLLNFKSKEEHIKDIETLIDSCLVENPYISTAELNKRLHKIGGFVKKDYFGFGNERISLEKSLVETLARNNKIAYRQSFHPASEEEIDIICKFTKYDYPDLLHVEPSKPGRYKPTETSKLMGILLNRNSEEKRMLFHEGGYRLIRNDSGCFVINLNEMTILDMNRADIPAALYSDILPGIVQSHSSGNVHVNEKRDVPQKRNARNLKGGNLSGGSSVNREWEVGKHEPDRDDPDRKLGHSL